ncbi:FERM PH-like domain protein [Cooperia oncophora]
MFFLEAHQQLRKGQLDLSNIDYVRVGGLLLQIYRGDFIEVMQIVEKCLKYGSRLYRVSETNGSSCILSINSRGIQVFENADTFRPKEDFHWFYLDNLYYKENIFSIEVRDPRSKQITDFNVLGASLAGDDDLAQAVSDPTTQ